LDEDGNERDELRPRTGSHRPCDLDAEASAERRYPSSADREIVDIIDIAR
jgi:hypothetical protein